MQSNSVVDEEKVFPFDFNYTIKKLDILLNSLVYNAPPSSTSNIKDIDKWIVRLPPYCSRLQSGYNCGLVGIRMAIEYLDKSFLEKEFVDELLMTAILKGYSKEGEMFSSYHLSEITNLIFNNLNFNYIKSTVLSFPSTADILNQLSNGLPILVPYDADKNWRPTCTAGKRAHWAMIIGFIIPNKINNNNTNNNNSKGSLKYKFKNVNYSNSNNNNYREETENFYDSCCINLENQNQYSEKYMFLNNNNSNIQSDKYKLQFYQKPIDSFNRLPFIDDDYDDDEPVDENEQQVSSLVTTTTTTTELNEDEIFLICQHGKSPIVQLWEYSLLKDSNNCLTEFPNERRNDERWIIPNDLNDLKNKWIFLKK